MAFIILNQGHFRRPLPSLCAGLLEYVYGIDSCNPHFDFQTLALVIASMESRFEYVGVYGCHSFNPRNLDTQTSALGLPSKRSASCFCSCTSLCIYKSSFVQLPGNLERCLLVYLLSLKKKNLLIST